MAQFVTAVHKKQALFHVGRWLRKNRRLRKGVLDANGNGMVLAQETRQAFGLETIVELMPSDAWLREMTPKFRTAFEEKTILIPAHLDVRDDVHQFRVINGVGRIPTDVRTEGTDGGRRHADAGVALLNFYAATLSEVVAIESRAAGDQRAALQAFGEPGRSSEPEIHEGRGFGTIGGAIDWKGY